MIDSYNLSKPYDANRWSSGRFFYYPTLTLMIDSYNLGKPHDAISDPWGRFFYPTLTLMIDSYSTFLWTQNIHNVVL